MSNPAPKIKAKRPELEPVAEAFNSVMARFLEGKVRPLSSRLVGLAIEVEAIEQEIEALKAQKEEAVK